MFMCVCVCAEWEGKVFESRGTLHCTVERSSRFNPKKLTGAGLNNGPAGMRVMCHSSYRQGGGSRWENFPEMLTNSVTLPVGRMG